MKYYNQLFDRSETTCGRAELDRLDRKTLKQKGQYAYWALEIPEDRMPEQERRDIPYILRAGEDGVTPEWIALLHEMDKAEELQDRREADHQDPRIKAQPAEREETDLLTAYPDLTYAPETQLFPVTRKLPFAADPLQELIQTLQPQQKELIYLYYVEQIPQADIAKAAGVTSAAIDGRRKKICKRLKNEYAEKYQIYDWNDCISAKNG